MNIEDKINQKRKEEENFIQKSLPVTFGEMKEDIIKAKKAEIGTISTHGGVKMRKEANGWVPVKEGSGEKKTQDNEEKPGVTPEELAEHATKVSEAALMNATKQSTDPSVRQAAHKELQRRKNEEAQETFKAPEGEKKKDEEPDMKDMMKRGLHAADNKKKETESGGSKKPPVEPPKVDEKASEDEKSKKKEEPKKEGKEGLGKTKSGKEISITQNAKLEATYTPQDHMDAAYTLLDGLKKMKPEDAKKANDRIADAFDRHIASAKHKALQNIVEKEKKNRESKKD